MKNVLVVSNPFAGGGVAVEVMEMYRKYAMSQNEVNYQFYLTQGPGDYEGIAAAVDCYEPEVVSIVGGDGTVNEVMNVENVRDKKIHIVPAGSGNDFHKLVYGDKTISESIQYSKSEKTKEYDLGKCNERYFMNGVGIGFDGNVARQTVRMKLNFIPSKFKYWIAILRNILFYKSSDITISYGDTTETHNLFMVDVANGTDCAGGFKVSPLSKADDGELNLIGIRNVSQLKRLAKLQNVKKGKHMNDPAVIHKQLPSVKISSEKVLHAHLDGELMSAKEFNVGVAQQVTFVV